MHFSTLFIAALGSLTAVQGLGINCEGNSNCASQTDNALSEVHDKIIGMASGNSNQWFGNGEHIACGGGTNRVCCFYQNIPSNQSIQWTVGQVGALIDHGCKGCGSIPTTSSNNVGDGELTCNWVS